MTLHKPLIALFACCLLLSLFIVPSSAQAAADTLLIGHWQINEKMSDNTDKKVEAALKAAGEKIKSHWFDSNKERYRGGPPEQELYDRISYDPTLTISADTNSYLFEYADNFKRPVYTDNRSRSVSLTQLDEVKDFSLGHWESDKFLVEGHPRDGGSIYETYTLLEEGKRLEVVCHILPQSFSNAIELRRVYDRVK